MVLCHVMWNDRDGVFVASGTRPLFFDATKCWQERISLPRNQDRGVMGGGGPRFSGRKTEEDLYCS